MKKAILLLLLFVLSFTQSKATHLEGGEITWVCIKSGPTAGMYIFYLKVYKDCNGGATVSMLPQNILVWNHPSIPSIQVEFLDTNDISPICDPINSGIPQTDCFNNLGPGSVQEYLFESLPINLPGIPPAGG